MSSQKSADTPDGYNTNETRATRLKADTERAYLRYRDEHDISDAEALRRLVRKALDDTDPTLETVNKASLAAALTYIAVYFFAGPTTAGTVGAAYITFLIIWSTYPRVGRWLP